MLTAVHNLVVGMLFNSEKVNTDFEVSKSLQGFLTKNELRFHYLPPPHGFA